MRRLYAFVLTCGSLEGRVAGCLTIKNTVQLENVNVCVNGFLAKEELNCCNALKCRKRSLSSQNSPSNAPSKAEEDMKEHSPLTQEGKSSTVSLSSSAVHSDSFIRTPDDKFSYPKIKTLHDRRHSDASKPHYHELSTVNFFNQIHLNNHEHPRFGGDSNHFSFHFLEEIAEEEEAAKNMVKGSTSMVSSLTAGMTSVVGSRFGVNSLMSSMNPYLDHVYDLWRHVDVKSFTGIAKAAEANNAKENTSPNKGSSSLLNGKKLDSSGRHKWDVQTGKWRELEPEEWRASIIAQRLSSAGRPSLSSLNHFKRNNNGSKEDASKSIHESTGDSKVQDDSTASNDTDKAINEENSPFVSTSNEILSIELQSYRRSLSGNTARKSSTAIDASHQKKNEDVLPTCSGNENNTETPIPPKTFSEHPYDYLNRMIHNSIVSSLLSPFSSVLNYYEGPKTREDVFDYHNNRDVLSQSNVEVIRKSITEEELRTRMPPSPAMDVRLPRLLFFGGDIVSVTALEALYERMYCIVENVIREQSKHTMHFMNSLIHKDNTNRSGGKHRAEMQLDEEVLKGLVQEVLQNYITVVCPSIPEGSSPRKIAEQFKRNNKQYPVLRFCLEKKIHVVPVDHPKSLKKSKMLKEMLAGRAGSGWKYTIKSKEVDIDGSDSSNQTEPLSTKLKRKNIMLSSIATNTRFQSLGKTTTFGATTTVQGKTTSGPKNLGACYSDGDKPLTWVELGIPLSYYDLAVVVSFRYFLPPELLEALPPTINMHPSLLPHYRGASPIFSTLLNNETMGGVSIIQIRKEDSGLMDSGHILWQCEVPVEPDCDIRTYFPLVTQVGAAGLCDLIFGEGDSNQAKSSNTEAKDSAVVNMHSVLRAKMDAILSHERTKLLRLYGDRDVRKHEKRWMTLCRSPSQITSSAVERALETHKLCFMHNSQLLGGFSDAIGTKVVASQAETVNRSPGHKGNEGKRNSRHSEKDKRGSTEINNANSHATQIVTLNCAEVFPDSVLNTTSDWPDSFTYSWRFSQNQNYEIINLAGNHLGKPMLQTTVNTYFTPEKSKYKSDPYHAPLLPKHVSVLRFSSYTDLEAYGVWRAFVGGEYFSPCVNATLDKGSTPVRNQLVRRNVRQHVRKRLSEKRKEEAKLKGNKDKNNRQKQGKHTGEHKPKPPPPVLDETIVTKQMILDSIEELRLSCSFTQVQHPEFISVQLQDELEAIEFDGKMSFYHPPPPLFHSILCGDIQFPLNLNCTQQSEPIQLNTIEKSLVPVSRRYFAARVSESKTATAARDVQVLQSLLDGGHSSSSAGQNGKERGKKKGGAQQGDDNEKEEDSTLLSDDDHTPSNYVPDVILAAPPASALATAPQKKKKLVNATATPVNGPDDDQSKTRQKPLNAAVESTQRSSENKHNDKKEPNKGEDQTPDGLHSSDLPSHNFSKLQPSFYYIPPGTGYFPKADETVGCIKCAEGWFFWKEAHLKHSPKPQPASLLRKGLAMKTGVLYPGLFSEYN